MRGTSDRNSEGSHNAVKSLQAPILSRTTVLLDGMMRACGMSLCPNLRRQRGKSFSAPEHGNRDRGIQQLFISFNGPLDMQDGFHMTRPALGSSQQGTSRKTVTRLKDPRFCHLEESALTVPPSPSMPSCSRACTTHPNMRAIFSYLRGRNTMAAEGFVLGRGILGRFVSRLESLLGLVSIDC